MNAIILAAGLGSRFKEITKHTHKALLPINNIPNIERTIQFLLEANIKDIFIITGYLSEQFEYLKEKYNCHLIHNPKYSEYNNIYSFYLAKDIFKDNFVIDSDVVLFSNIFLEFPPSNSCYYLIKRPKSENQEWIPIIDENNRITDITISNDEKHSLLGISFWKEQDSIIIKKELQNYISPNMLTKSSLYWDNIPMKLLSSLNVKTKILDITKVYEMDRVEDYELIKNKYIKCIN